MAPRLQIVPSEPPPRGDDVLLLQPSTRLEPGVVLQGKWRLDRVLGRGAMGEVFETTHVHLRRRFALKVLLPQARKQRDAVDRFLREAQIGATLRSEHVVRVQDADVLADGTPFFVMEYVEGRDLDRVLDERGSVPVHEAVEYVLHACVALAEAHAAGIVHRDLKPANLLVTRGIDGAPLVKVVDFGISKARPQGVLEEMMATSASNEILGTPLYMSPEQLRGDEVDARADVWSLGMVLRELLAGMPAFVAGSIPELCAKILSDAPAPAMARPLPEGLDAVIAGALEKRLDQRFADVGEIARALVPFAPRRALFHADRAQRILGRVPPAPPAPQSSAEVDEPPSKSWRFWKR